MFRLNRELTHSLLSTGYGVFAQTCELEEAGIGTHEQPAEGSLQLQLKTPHPLHIVWSKRASNLPQTMVAMTTKTTLTLSSKYTPVKVHS